MIPVRNPMRFQLASILMAAVVAAVGVAVMVGWLLDVKGLKSVFPGLATMKFNTALCFFLSSVGLYGAQKESQCLAYRAGALCVPLVLVIATLTLIQYGLTSQIGIDELFIHDPDTAPAAWPGRMSVATALNFVFIALALLMHDRKIALAWQLPSAMALVVILIGSAALLGYLYGVKTIRFSAFSTMAFHTSVLFILLGLGVLLTKPTGYFMAEIVSPKVGVILPVLVTVPIVLGWVSLRGLRNGTYGPEFGFAFNTLSSVMALAVLGWFAARSLNRMQDRLDKAHSQRAFLASIVETSDDAIVSKDLNGEVISWNRSAERIYGYSQSEMIGQPMSMLFPDDKLGEEALILARVQQGDRIEHFETVRRRRDGCLVDMSIAVSPIIDAQGNVVAASNVGRDISERKRAENELELKTQELIRSNRDLEQFAYVASHDLQEPLRAVSWSVQLLDRYCRERLDAKAKKFMAYAVDGADRMQSLIDDLLVYSRVGRPENIFQEVNCEKVVRTALHNLVGAVSESQADIKVDALPVVRGVPGQLLLLFQNLLSNGIKFRRCDNPVRIAVSVKREGSECLFSVQDNGIGVEAKYFGCVFTIFQRLHTRQEYPGTGIGLALCKRIVEQHKGRIWMESEVGRGTTVFFTLPAVDAETRPSSLAEVCD